MMETAEKKLQLLKSHFKLLYRLFVDYRYIPEASYDDADGLEQYFTGIPAVNFNAVIGALENPHDFDRRIQEQMQFFGKTPFFWYVEEEASPEFKEALKKKGFVDAGIFRGVIGPLEATIATSPIPSDCTFEMVQDEQAMEDFNALVCHVFGMVTPTKEAYKKILWQLSQEKPAQMHHWIARKDGKAVSAVSTLIQDGVASFWNGATDAEFRKQGLSSALRRFALQHAMQNGASFGSSYLMSEGLALGICSKLGFETKWRFHAFVSPTKP